METEPMVSVLMRWLFAFMLLAVTYNPTPYNYVRFGLDNYLEATSFVALGGIVLFIGYVIYLRATLRSIGGFGMFLVAALVGAVIWVAVDLGLVDLEDPTLNLWLAIFAVSVVLGIGLSWSIVRRRLSGQADVDDVEE
ncbi:MAG: DUF6524 family protein [Pseudomonadota bacterium]